MKFTEKQTQMANKHVKIFSILQVIRKMQFKEQKHDTSISDWHK